jgi:hypothetical protein
MSNSPTARREEPMSRYLLSVHTAAREWATKTSTVVGMPIELRPFLDTR